MLVLGVAYKRDVDDLRESPALTIIELLQQGGRGGGVQRSVLSDGGAGRQYDLQMDVDSAGGAGRSLTAC